MNPVEDPTWPRCGDTVAPAHPSCEAWIENYWCSHVRQFLVDNRDAWTISTGQRVCVPIVPELNCWAEVAIDTNEVMPDAARMFLVKNIPFEPDEELVELGLWSAGEGRVVLADVVGDHLRVELHDGHLKCKQKSHGFKDEVTIERSARENPKFSKANDWTIFSTGMCVPCYNRYLNINTGSNFGLSGVTSTHGQAMSSLRNRFA